MKASRFRLYAPKSSRKDFEFRGLGQRLSRSGCVTSKNKLDPSPPVPQCSADLDAIIGLCRSDYLPGSAVNRSLEQRYPTGYLGGPNEAQAGGLEGIFRARIVPPAGEPALLMI